jgi:hypothetical protein
MDYKIKLLSLNLHGDRFLAHPQTSYITNSGQTTLAVDTQASWTMALLL